MIFFSLKKALFSHGRRRNVAVGKAGKDVGRACTFSIKLRHI
jgi:hypothetical protein